MLTRWLQMHWRLAHLSFAVISLSRRFTSCAVVRMTEQWGCAGQKDAHHAIWSEWCAWWVKAHQGGIYRLVYLMWVRLHEHYPRWVRADQVSSADQLPNSGIGPCKAYELIKKYKTIEAAMSTLDKKKYPVESIHQISSWSQHKVDIWIGPRGFRLCDRTRWIPKPWNYTSSRMRGNHIQQRSTDQHHCCADQVHSARCWCDPEILNWRERIRRCSCWSGNQTPRGSGWFEWFEY